jgi:hypothetical protein
MLHVTKHVVWHVYVLRPHIYMVRFYFFTCLLFTFYIIQRYTSHRTMWKCEEVGRYASLVLPRSSEHWPWCDVTKAEYSTRDDVTFYTVYPSHKTYPCKKKFWHPWFSVFLLPWKHMITSFLTSTFWSEHSGTAESRGPSKQIQPMWLHYS